MPGDGIMVGFMPCLESAKRRDHGIERIAASVPQDRGLVGW
jgi:hypothetical protein